MKHKSPFFKERWENYGDGTVIAVPGFEDMPTHLWVTTIAGSGTGEIMVLLSEVEDLIEALQKAHQHLKGGGS